MNERRSELTSGDRAWLEEQGISGSDTPVIVLGVHPEAQAMQIRRPSGVEEEVTVNLPVLWEYEINGIWFREDTAEAQHYLIEKVKWLRAKPWPAPFEAERPLIIAKFERILQRNGAIP